MGNFQAERETNSDRAMLTESINSKELKAATIC